MAGLLVAAALFSACGGEDRPSKEEYIRQADAICADYDRRLDAIPEPSPPVTEQQLQSFIDQARPLTEEQVAKVKALKRPKGKDPKLDEVFRAIDAALANIRSLTGANFEERAPELDRLTDEANRVAREYGFVECSKGD